MARKAAAKAVEVKEEVKAVEAVTETAVEKTPVEAAPVEAAPVEETPKKRGRKPAAKKAEEKKPAAKKTAEKKTTIRKTAPKTNLFIQYKGAELSYADLIERAKADAGVEAPKAINLYVKPEDNMVYYVVDEKVGGFAIS